MHTLGGRGVLWQSVSCVWVARNFGGKPKLTLQSSSSSSSRTSTPRNSPLRLLTPRGSPRVEPTSIELTEVPFKNPPPCCDSRKGTVSPPPLLPEEDLPA